MKKNFFGITMGLLVTMIAPCYADNGATKPWYAHQTTEKTYAQLKQENDQLNAEKQAQEAAQLFELIILGCSSCLDRRNKPDTKEEYEKIETAYHELEQKTGTQEAREMHKKVIDRGWKKTWADHHPYLYCIGLPIALTGTAVAAVVGYAITRH